MLMDQFEKWKWKQGNIQYRVEDVTKKDHQDFIKFYEDHVHNMQEDPLTELAYQIYNLQVCMEGLLDDFED